MASAGQAHAHSSQPTHFSSPSACRLSWCRPWKRAWVGSFTSGYCTVFTWSNIVRNVTQKPFTASSTRLGLLPFRRPPRQHRDDHDDEDGDAERGEDLPPL